jgi:hypothetical protein
MIGLCTDSRAQLPAVLVGRFGIEVVPMTVRLGDDEFLEGVDIGHDELAARLAGSPPPRVSLAAPSPGQFALAFERLAERGATEILSVHAGHACGTPASARLAAKHSPVPVRLVETATSGFGHGCCVWAAAEAVARGARLCDAACVAEALGPRVVRIQLDHLGAVADLLRALPDIPSRLNVGVGASCPTLAPLQDDLAARLHSRSGVAEVVCYQVSACEAGTARGPALELVYFPA